MKNIIYVPLDERPCNYAFMPMIARGTEYSVLVPPLELLGAKKTPADTQNLWNWVFQHAGSAEGAILSIDMLVYGGIVPSRLHYLSVDQCRESLENVKKLRSINHSIKIYAFNLIMRCPTYSSSDEEPDYYENYGHEIFKTGYLRHKTELGLCSPEDAEELKAIKNRLPDNILQDYADRRQINREVNKLSVNLVRDGVIDFLVIPQDDSSPFGFTAVDQRLLRTSISENNLNMMVYMYPGADEVGMTLFARMVNQDKKLRPNVCVRFSSINSPYIIPLYEDRMLYESIKYQVLCAGGLICSSLPEADVVLMVNSPVEKMAEAWEQGNKNIHYDINRNLIEFTEYMDYIVNTKKMACAVADVAYANGGDLELVNNLRTKKLLFKLSSYAGWNTSSNTLGTAITQAFIRHIYQDCRSHLDFLGLRYVEDAAYCSHVRKYVTDHCMPAAGLNYFKTDGPRGKVSEIVKIELQKFADSRLTDDHYKIKIEDVYMPWSRMFEVGLDVKVLPNAPH